MAIIKKNKKQLIIETQTRPIKKVLVANRGEIACRIFSTLAEMNIETVAIYTETDKNSLHVQQANYAFALQQANTPLQSYLNIDDIITIALNANVDAIHPGFGLLSENTKFAKACEEAGIIFIGPSAQIIEKMGDKITAKQLAKQANVPIVSGFMQSEHLESDDAKWLQEAEKIGYPLLVKATAGGGGKGMRIVQADDALPAAIAAAQREAQAAFSDGRVFLEKYIENPRHIEVQILADTQGTVLHLFERDCSTQRRHQKVIEEAPAPHLPEDIRQAIFVSAVSLAKNVEYTNAGTVEFIYDVDNQQYYFLEMNTRLQVEHPVTEFITGFDIVRKQIEIAECHPIGKFQTEIQVNGHALECRIYAEDPERQFLPSTGVLHCFDYPNWPGIRVDTGVIEGDTISIDFDPMLAKVSCYAASREQARLKMLAFLKHFKVLGVITNIQYLCQLLDSADFINGNVSTKLIENTPCQKQNEVIPETLLCMFSKSTFVTTDSKIISEGVTEFSPWTNLPVGTL